MKGCSFGFKAVEYDHNFTEEECRELFARTEDDVSWDIDQSVGCTSLGDSKPQSTVDTSNFKKHVYNCPGVSLQFAFMNFAYVTPSSHNLS